MGFCMQDLTRCAVMHGSVFNAGSSGFYGHVGIGFVSPSKTE